MSFGNWVAAKYERLTMLPTSHQSGMGRRRGLAPISAYSLAGDSFHQTGTFIWTEPPRRPRLAAENRSHDRTSWPFLRNAAVDNENYNLSITDLADLETRHEDGVPNTWLVWPANPHVGDAVLLP